MANTIRLAVATRNAMLDALRARIDAGAGPGVLLVYDGTPPADGDAALAGNTLLATLTFSDPAAPAAASGVLTFSAIASGTAVATGEASFCRVQDSAGNSVCDFDAATSGAVFNLNTTAIVAGGPVVATTATISLPG